MNPRTIILMGPQGSGKGTQLKIIEEKLSGGVEVFGTGDMFRALQQKGSYTADKVAESIDKGQLQPVALSIALWGHDFVERMTKDVHTLIDGFPRYIVEAEMLENFLKFYERTPGD
jgi:adenylate kinase